MKKFSVIFAMIACVAACDKKTENDAIVRTCGDYTVEIKLSENGDTIDATINGDATTLNLAVSASGARYVGILNDTNVTLWNKGEGWTLFLGDDDTAVAIECVAK